MNKYYANDILGWTIDDLWEQVTYDSTLPKEERFLLEFEDEQIETTWAETMFSWHFWEPHRQYQETPLLSNCHIRGDIFSPENQERLLARGKYAVIDQYGYDRVDQEELNRIAYQITNDLHNWAVGDLEEYMGPVDALDNLQIYQHPRIIEQNARILKDPSKRMVNSIYQNIKDILLHDEDLRENSICNSLRQGTMKLGQLLQIVSMRGYCSEINQKIFSTVIPVGFLVGLNRCSFYGMESRSASTAMLSTDDPVKQTEYYNREMQLLNYGVDTIDFEDCGTQTTIPWEVEAEHLDNWLAGKYYKTSRGWEAIRKKDRHLIGKVIQMRTPRFCNHPDEGTLCAYCIGVVAESFQPNANIQYQASVTQNESGTQNTISVKHLLMSAVSEAYIIEHFYQEYIENIGNDKEISLTKELWMRDNVTVKFEKRDVYRLADIHQHDVAHIDVSTISKIRSMIISYTEKSHTDPVTVHIPLNKGSYVPYLTPGFLNYIKEFGYDFDDKYIIVNLAHWADGEVLLRLPERRSSVLEALLVLKKEIFAIGDEAKDAKLRLRMDLSDPMLLSKALKQIADLTNERFNISFPIIELTMLAMMCRDPENDDFRLPKEGTPARFATQSAIMNGKSLSGKAAYQRQFEMVVSPDSYLNDNRVDHPYDNLLVSDQMMEIQQREQSCSTERLRDTRTTSQ